MQTKWKQVLQRLSKIYSKGGIWIILLILVVIMSFVSDKFLTYDNIIAVMRQNSVVAIAAVGLSFLIMSGQMDMSSGQVANIAGVSVALLMVSGVPVPLAIVIGVAEGILIGFINGVVSTYLGVPAFITTLGMQYVLNGLMFIMTGGYPVINLPAGFLEIARGYMFNAVPYLVVIALTFTVVGAFVYKYTKFGRNIISVGCNSTASRLSGINVNKTMLLTFMLEGACCATAGIVWAARTSSGTPGAVTTLSLEAMSAVFVGGTTFRGSNQGLWGTLAGVLIIGVIKNGMNLMSISSYWQNLVLGIITIAVVAADSLKGIQIAQKGTK